MTLSAAPIAVKTLIAWLNFTRTIKLGPLSYGALTIPCDVSGTSPADSDSEKVNGGALFEPSNPLVRWYSDLALIGEKSVPTP